MIKVDRFLIKHNKVCTISGLISAIYITSVLIRWVI